VENRSPIVVRGAVVADAPAISALIQSLLHYRAAAPAPPPPAAFAEQFQAGTLARLIASDDHRYHVALDGDQLVGVIGVRGRRHLLHLFVAESHHRRGIARALWHQAVATVLEVESEVEMTVRSSIYATEVYRRFGFRSDGPQVDSPGVSWVPMRMCLRRD
jgi:ribosomal protein S18 acetylase RimI-like enzyme